MRPLFPIALVLATALSAPLPAQEGRRPSLTAIGDPDHGAHVLGPDGRAVYAFLTGEGIGGDGLDPLESCDTFCRDNWGLIPAEGAVTVGDGLYPDLAGTREVDGEPVLTYNDHLLFQFYRDAVGDRNGQGIFSFGGYWALLTPSGEPIRTGPMDEEHEQPPE